MHGNSIVEEKEPNFSNLAHILGPLPKACSDISAYVASRVREEKRQCSAIFAAITRAVVAIWARLASVRWCLSVYPARARARTQRRVVAI